jgi:hypothetical protein
VLDALREEEEEEGDGQADGQTNSRKSCLQDDRDRERSKPSPPIPSLKAGDDTVRGVEEPLVDEIASALREWHSVRPSSALAFLRLYEIILRSSRPLFVSCTLAPLSSPPLSKLRSFSYRPPTHPLPPFGETSAPRRPPDSGIGGDHPSTARVHLSSSPRKRSAESGSHRTPSVGRASHDERGR